MISRGLLPFSGPLRHFWHPARTPKKKSGPALSLNSGCSCRGPEQLISYYPGRGTRVHRAESASSKHRACRDHSHMTITASAGWQLRRPGPGASGSGHPRLSGVRPNRCPAAQARWPCCLTRTARHPPARPRAPASPGGRATTQRPGPGPVLVRAPALRTRPWPASPWPGPRSPEPGHGKPFALPGGSRGRPSPAGWTPFRIVVSRVRVRGLAEADVDVLEALMPFGPGVGGVGTLVCGREFDVVGERREQAARP
jgi:hypothetical protein